MPTYRIATLGCRTNQYESAGYRTQLEALGYREAGEGEEPDLCIVNTCTVTDQADKESKRRLRQLVQRHPGAKIVATGCAVEGKDLKGEIEGLDEVVPNKSKERLIEQLFPDVENLPEFKIDQFAAHTRAFVKVQDGCNSYCTYCIIPYVRGRSRSRPMAEILREVEGLIAGGYKEIVLTGINIGDFEDGELRLADLVRAVDRLPGLERLRISSIDPDEVDDALLDAVVGGKRTCPSMHIVLQAGSNVTLKRMNRKYTRQMFFETVERLKNAHADFTFTTDIIVGFPGETEEDFLETLDVMEQVEFAKVHFFPYSKRERTRAALYPDQVPPDVMAERKQRILRLAERQAHALRERYVGRTMEVLVEGDGAGHTVNFLPVKLTQPMRPNTLVQVKLTENRPDTLVGEPL
jgi:threonylcarbamoyladenosine tRNA methylthiotransferase MtaB